MTDKLADTLKPCPFCGGKPVEKIGVPGCRWIECTQCHSQTTDCNLPDIRWNNRHVTTHTPADVQEAVERISARFDDEGLCYSDVKQFTQDWNLVKDFVSANVIDWDCLQKISDEMPVNKQSGQLEMWIHENTSVAIRPQGVTLPREVVEVSAAEFGQMIYAGCGELASNHVKFVLKDKGLIVVNALTIAKIRYYVHEAARGCFTPELTKQLLDDALALLDQHARGG